MIQAKTKSWSDTALRIIGLFSQRTVSFCLFAMIFMVVLDILLRSLFQSGLPGTVEINEYLLIIAGFMGIVQTNSINGHISVELVFDKFTPGLKRILEQVTNIVLLIFFSLFFWAGLKKSVSALHSGETNWFGSHVLPVWFFRWVVPISCGLLCLQIIAKILKSIKEPPITKEP